MVRHMLSRAVRPMVSGALLLAIIAATIAATVVAYGELHTPSVGKSEVPIVIVTSSIQSRQLEPIVSFNYNQTNPYGILFERQN